MLLFNRGRAVTDYPTEMTRLIGKARNGDRDAEGRLYAMIYDDLHCAAERIAREGHAASASSLVHEGFVRLFREGQLNDVPSRKYFFFAATRKMRDVLAER